MVLRLMMAAILLPASLLRDAMLPSSAGMACQGFEGGAGGFAEFVRLVWRGESWVV